MKLGIKGQQNVHVVAENVIFQVPQTKHLYARFSTIFLNYISEKQYPKICFIIKKCLFLPASRYVSANHFTEKTYKLSIFI